MLAPTVSARVQSGSVTERRLQVSVSARLVFLANVTTTTDRSQKRSKNFFCMFWDLKIREYFWTTIIWSGTKSVVALPMSSHVLQSRKSEKSVKNLWKSEKNPSDHWPASPWSKKSVISVTDFSDQVTKSSDQVTKSCDQGQNHLKKRLQPDQIHLARGGSYYYRVGKVYIFLENTTIFQELKKK